MNNKKLKIEELKLPGAKVGNFTKKAIRAIPINKKSKIESKDIKTILDSLLKQGIKSQNISISCMGIDGRHFTLKSFSDFQLKDYTDEDYILNKVKDDSKFGLYEYVDVIVKK
jgi:hypothetical protein